MAVLWSNNGILLSCGNNILSFQDNCPCGCPDCADHTCALCLTVKITGAGVYSSGSLWNQYGNSFFPFSCETYGNCIVSSKLAYYDRTYCDQVHAVVTCGAPYRWSHLQTKFGATLDSVGGWYLVIGYEWDRMDRNGTDLEDEDRPPIILKPTTPTSGCPAFGDWEIAWAPDGYDDSTFACVVGGSTECAVCSGNTGTTNPSTNCMDNLDFTDCHCSYNVTISGVASTADPNDCSVPWNTDHGDLNKSGSGVWTKTNSTQDYKIFCSNSSTYTGLTDGNYYWCLLMEYQIYPELGKLYCRLTAATDCDFAGTYTPHSVTRYGCTYTSNGTVTISEA